MIVNTYIYFLFKSAHLSHCCITAFSFFSYGDPWRHVHIGRSRPLDLCACYSVMTLQWLTGSFCVLFPHTPLSIWNSRKQSLTGLTAGRQRKEGYQVWKTIHPRFSVLHDFSVFHLDEGLHFWKWKKLKRMMKTLFLFGWMKWWRKIMGFSYFCCQWVNVSLQKNFHLLSCIFFQTNREAILIADTRKVDTLLVDFWVQSLHVFIYLIFI